MATMDTTVHAGMSAVVGMALILLTLKALGRLDHAGTWAVRSDGWRDVQLTGDPGDAFRWVRLPPEPDCAAGRSCLHRNEELVVRGPCGAAEVTSASYAEGVASPHPPLWCFAACAAMCYMRPCLPQRVGMPMEVVLHALIVWVLCHYLYELNTPEEMRSGLRGLWDAARLRRWRGDTFPRDSGGIGLAARAALPSQRRWRDRRHPSGECTGDLGCPAGWDCVEGACLQRCARSDDPRDDGGGCRTSRPLCQSDDSCPLGWLCTQDGACEQTCLSEATPHGPDGRCRGPVDCTDDEDCPVGMSCNRAFCCRDGAPRCKSTDAEAAQP